ncbi:patatin-like phospholipase family protein [candidate division CSSED10-310 bacterium]|uniref:Patatin-like phospholipase family protein n=1 Tax=candidate division CSSED10-310 bacterium TaxID=2855610 RepID=A0ABV6Z1I2_UNCC1
MERALILAGGGTRGAFQVGVWQYLREKRWEPDMICGSSVGAINATAIGSGISIEQLLQLWRTCERRNVYRMTLGKSLRALLHRDKFVALSRTEPLRVLLKKHLNVEVLRNSKTEIIITAVNLYTSHLTFFNQHSITVDHVMAATAIPMLFPWQFINQEPYWDGGVMANLPLGPALNRNIRDIIVVLLSPVGRFAQPLPKDHRQVAELTFEQLLLGSFDLLTTDQFRADHKFESRAPDSDDTAPRNGKSKIHFVAPTRMLGFRSLLHFSQKQTNMLLKEGYENAHQQLTNLFN